MSTAPAAEILPQTQSDELAVRTVIDRYFYALDAIDRQALETVFAADVEVQYHTGTEAQFVQRGAENIVNYLVGNMGNYKSRTHVGANTHVVLSGDTASTVTHAVATLWKGERLVVRGLRYTDELVRAGDSWRIRRRKHQPLWQFAAEPSAPDVPAPALKLAAEQRAAAEREAST